MAGATATAPLTLGVLSSSVGASAALATTAPASAMDSGSRSAAGVVAHPFAFSVGR
ncbi:hypothetical protein ACFZDK_28870 [Streptomyces sp. NPDC007901]|uniref:hypothetical protein n=1 Tax=Streptomyces sp. NPDC007901 TaxID=3364785 RepID=UPI0036E554C4